MRVVAGLRLLSSKRDPRSGSKVAAVARAVGYDSEAALSRAFNKAFGVSRRSGDRGGLI